MLERSSATRFQLDDCGSLQCHLALMGGQLQGESTSPVRNPLSSSDSDPTRRSRSSTPCQCLEKYRLEAFLHHREMKLKHRMQKSRSNQQRYRGGKSVKSMYMENRKRRPNRRHQQHSRRRCGSLPRCNIKCQTFAVHRFESIPSRSPCINVPTALSHRSRNTPSPFRSHPPTSGQHRMHLVRRREAPFPVSLPTSLTIRTLQRLKAKFRLFQAVLRAAAPPCPSRRAHVSS